VVTSSSCPTGSRSTAQSSPIPVLKVLRPALEACARLRMRSISCLSGRGTHQLYSREPAENVMVGQGHCPSRCHGNQGFWTRQGWAKDFPSM
jgi:hypothetical protein